MKKVYAKQLPDVPYIPLLYPNLGFQERESILFLNNAFKHLKDPIVELVDDPSEADAILVPHNYPSLHGYETYIKEQADLAEKLGKRLIIFWHGDSDAPVAIENATVFRTSQYRTTLRSNEVMMPAYAEDLLQGDLQVRSKHAGKATVGFCGWAGYKNLKNRIATLIKNIYYAGGPRTKGITFRMRAMNLLASSSRVDSNFIIRSSYSGHSKTVQTDVETTRREYIDNLLGSDYALVIKGDGNYSYRFYEALSLGRIPVLLDTDCVLPLEDEIDYDSCILRVPYQNLNQLDRMIAEHWNRLTDDQFTAMQRKAREVFETHLRVDTFLRSQF